MTRDAFEYAKTLLEPGDIVKVTNKVGIGGFNPNIRFTPRVGVFQKADNLYLYYTQTNDTKNMSGVHCNADCKDHYKKIISIEKIGSYAASSTEQSNGE